MTTLNYLPLLAQESSVPALSTAAEGLSQEQWFVLMLVGMGCVTVAILALAGIFAGITTTIHRRSSETELKRDMLDRGMSAAEIAQVVEATPPTDFLQRLASRHAKRGKQ
ncbi:MAG: hypothetical protein AAF589_08140 [Planctomycetota bacterium]